MIQSWEKIIDPNFISAEEIGPVGSEFVATVTDIDFVEYYDQQTRKKAEKQAVKFAECKPLILNKTNSKMLRKLFDPENEDPRKCLGKKLTMYVTTAKVAGKTVDCIRLKEYSGIKCESCGNLIEGTATWNISKVIKYSRQHCNNHVYCMACMKEIAKKGKETNE